jgi:hypothetical protein
MSYSSFIMKFVMIRWIKRYQLNCFLYRKITKEWNMEEHRLYDDGDPPQSAKSKAISIWLTCFGLCVKWFTPQLMLIDSSWKDRYGWLEGGEYALSEFLIFFNFKAWHKVNSLDVQLGEFPISDKHANKQVTSKIQVRERTNRRVETRDTRMYSRSSFLLSEVRLWWRGVVTRSLPTP